MNKEIIRAVINLLQVTLGNISCGKADAIVSQCIKLLEEVENE